MCQDLSRSKLYELSRRSESVFTRPLFTSYFNGSFSLKITCCMGSCMHAVSFAHQQAPEQPTVMFNLGADTESDIQMTNTIQESKKKKKCPTSHIYTVQTSKYAVPKF